ncbi:MAG: NAD(P)H-hydrate dehydratase, partial [Gaiellaceae bacterium]
MWTDLYTAEEMRAAEAAYRGPTLELMERAGRKVAEEILGRYPDARHVAVSCGTGANGGDGFVVARELARARRACSVRLLGAEEKVTGDAAVNLRRARLEGIPFVEEPGAADVVVDALFGTGFRGKPRRDAAQAIEQMNAAGVPIVAVDLPSGVDASTGRVDGAVVRASLTVTFHAPKVGHVVAPGRFHVGTLVVADIGLGRTRTRTRRATARLLEGVPRRREQDNKYSAGSVLVVGGSTGLTGAPCLTAQAALRAGAGIVTACVPASLNVVFEQRLLEVMTRPCPDEDGTMTRDAADTILAAAERAGAVALGPGLGRTEDAQALVGHLLDRLDKPVVLDADGLWALVGHLDWVFSRDAPTVLTPHAGELGRLLERPSSWVDARRLHAVQSGADDTGAVVLLKGADTLVAAPGRGPVVVDLGNAGLATAGSGDVLTGVAAAFLAKGMD